MKLPKIVPLALTRCAKPFDHADWVFELKQDGFRGMAYIGEGKSKLISRTDHVFQSFGLLRKLLANLPVQNAIIDGEIVCLNDEGVSQFNELMFRRGVPYFYGFDLVWLNGEDLRLLPLTHGAGANCQSPLLMAVATAFCESGVTVLRCDLPFRQLQPDGPPPRGSSERDQMGLRRAIKAMRQQVPGRIFLSGHSYGGRQGSMLAASEPGLVNALLLLSYPLHPPKRPTELRTAHFPALQTPTVFIHGTRDGFGSIEEITAALRLIPVPAQLVPVQGAGHELMIARNRADLPKMILKAFAEAILNIN